MPSLSSHSSPPTHTRDVCLSLACDADGKGNPMTVPPLIQTISKHPLLSKVKLIAEPWDLGMYQVSPM